MFCGHCGQHAYDEDNYCTNCGKSLRRNVAKVLQKAGFNEAELDETNDSKSPIHTLIGDGLRLTNLGKNSQAADTFAKAYNLDAEKASSETYRKGLRLAKCGIYSEALECFENSLRLNPKYIEAMYAKACLLALRGEKEPAISMLNTIVEIKPEYKRSIIENEIFEKLKNEPRFEGIMRHL